MSILIVFLLLPLALSSTCPSSASSNTAIFTQKDTFSGYTNVETEELIIGEVDGSYYISYYLYLPTPSTYTAIRKINADGTLAWMAVVNFLNSLKSLAVDSKEQNVYISKQKNPMVVVRFQANDGVIVDAVTHSSIDGTNSLIKIHVLSDNSGYYIIGKHNISYKATI